MRAPASLIRFTGRDPSAEVPILERRDAAAPAIFVARIPDGWAWANDVRDLWDTGLVPKRWDRAGIAGLLWRGGPVNARRPEAGVRSIAPGETWRLTADGPAISRQAPKPIEPTTPEDVRSRLVEWVRASGATDILGGDGASTSALMRLARDAGLDLGTTGLTFELGVSLTACVPSADGLEEFLDRSASRRTRRIGPTLDGRGGSALFGANPMYAEWQGGQSRSVVPSKRAKPGGDPMDVAEQRGRELAVFRSIPVNWAHSYLAPLPAATREAISTVGPRPADGLMPTGHVMEVLSEVAWSRDADRAALLREAEIHCPFLDEGIVRAIRGLPMVERFGRPGSGGLLSRWGAGADSVGDSGGASEDTVRGMLSLKWDGDLAPARIAEHGIFRPEAVSRAIASWRAGKAGWTTRRLLLLTGVTDWVAHRGVAPWRD